MSVIKGSSRKGNKISGGDNSDISATAKVRKLGTILHKAGVFIPHSEGSTSGTTPPHDIIEGYVLEVSHNMLKQSEESLREENHKLRNHIENSKKETNTDDVDEETKDYLNLMTDVKRIDKCLRRLDKRMRKTKVDDVAVKCANAIGLLEGKKLLLIQAVTHKR